MQVGSQPSSTPTDMRSRATRGGVRTYRPQERLEIVDGRPTMVTRRVSKRLIDGIWEGEVVVLGIQDVA